jgi:hypothetical protein
MLGASDNNSAAFAISTAAIGSARCASRSALLAKASKIPNVDASILMANQTIVPTSSFASCSALFKKSATVCYLSAFAFTVARIATVTIMLIPVVVCGVATLKI